MVEYFLKEYGDGISRVASLRCGEAVDHCGVQVRQRG